MKEAGYEAHEREIVKLAVGLGFNLRYPHNKAHVLVEPEEKIREISTRAGFSAGFYNDVKEARPYFYKKLVISKRNYLQ
ncbi:MAG: hypothetical protein NTY79_02755 [Chloroflexi bacterium]|nr:hypothetical protein [Chloroflexota bacterium]